MVSFGLIFRGLNLSTLIPAVTNWVPILWYYNQVLKVLPLSLLFADRFISNLWHTRSLG